MISVILKVGCQKTNVKKQLGGRFYNIQIKIAYAAIVIIDNTEWGMAGKNICLERMWST